ncbi:MAG: ornithine carbamoyltransferase [Pseudomonadota bacterium]
MRQNRRFLDLSEMSQCQVQHLLERARNFRDAWQEDKSLGVLDGKNIALVVSDGGWRNTAAFDLGIQWMGGRCVHVPIKLGQREDIGDLAAYLGNWFDAIVVRAPSLSDIAELSDKSAIPVINARTRSNHPCETLGDLAFYHDRHGSIEGITVGVVGPDANILGSWIEIAQAVPLNVVQVYPKRWHAKSYRKRFTATEDVSALHGADILVTDCWPDDGSRDQLLPFQITTSILDRLSSNAEFIPCPPVHRDNEVAASALEHRTCEVIAAKDFLLHAQNAVLEWVFES